MPLDTDRRPSRGRLGVWTAVGIVLVLAAGACGSQLSQSRLIEDNAGGSSAQRAAAQQAQASAPAGSTGPSAPAGSTVLGAAASGTTGSSGDTTGTPGAASPGSPTVDTVVSPSTGGAGGGSSGGGVTTQVCAEQKAPIVIGSVGEQSGFIGSFIRTGPIAVAAWVASINAAGGIGCHPLKYIIVDDGGDPARNQALTAQLVEQDHVVAIVHEDAPIAGQASVSYATAHKIPVIGNETGSPWFYTSPYYFPQSSTGAQTLEGVVLGAGKYFVPRGQTRLAAFACVEASICSTLTQIAPSAARQAGMQLVYSFSGSLAQPDYTSACQAAQAAKAQVLLFAFDPNGAARLQQSCASIGYHPSYVTGGPVVNATVLQNPNFNNLLDVSVVMPPTADVPAAAAFRSTMARYSPGISDDGAAMTGWVSAQLFGAAAAAAPDPTTSQGILQGLWSLKNFDANGLTAPLSFQQGKDATPEICYWDSVVTNGNLAPVSTQRTCG
jgi:branched-chain amino acid transport system substrate-binding protein